MFVLTCFETGEEVAREENKTLIAEWIRDNYNPERSYSLRFEA